MRSWGECDMQPLSAKAELDTVEIRDKDGNVVHVGKLIRNASQTDRMSSISIHEKSLSTATQIARFQMDEIISPQQVIAILNRAKIRFVLVGAYGLAGWMKPRATKDVDVVVALRQVKKAVRLLTESFPNLEAEDVEVVVRLRDRTSEEVIIDVMKPVQQPYREIFKHTTKVAVKGQEYRVPSLEMALTCKFAPIISLARVDARKYQDAHDFIVMVQQNSNIDLEKLAELGDLIYSGGGKEIVEMVRQVRAGEKLSL
jgi:hypothetical protein